VTDLDHVVYSLHALDRMVERAIRVDEVRRAMDQDGPTSLDLDGNHRYDAAIDGRRLRVVTAADNPLLVITVYVLRGSR
jgi:quinol monooxygenase YgiN